MALTSDDSGRKAVLDYLWWKEQTLSIGSFALGKVTTHADECMSDCPVKLETGKCTTNPKYPTGQRNGSSKRRINVNQEENESTIKEKEYEKKQK